MVENLTDQELMNNYYEAVEMQDGKLINSLKQEMNRRNAEL